MGRYQASLREQVELVHHRYISAIPNICFILYFITKLYCSYLLLRTHRYVQN
nr:MAG TPA: hypothetical protein [Caudoviricetes sp.]